ncbi:hypothetical protein CsSME_00038063 [Camellia sinensis var. sinensis]
MRNGVVCTRVDFFNEWAQIEKELNRSFKASIVLRPFQLNKALFFAKSIEEADYYGAQGVCFFNKSIVVRLEQWSKEKHGRADVIASNGGWVSVCDLPFNLWNDRVFEWIGSKCGGLIEVDRRTRTLGSLFEARLGSYLQLLMLYQSLSEDGRFTDNEGFQESQGTTSTRGKMERRRQLGDLIKVGAGSG